MIESHVQAEYEKVWQFCQTHDLEDANLIRLSGEFRGGYWRDYYYNLLNRLSSLQSKIVVDLGCKYGHVFPLFLALGLQRLSVLKWKRSIFGMAAAFSANYTVIGSNIFPLKTVILLCSQRV